MSNSTRVVVSYLFSFYCIFALNQRKKWLLQNKKKIPTTTLKAPKQRAGCLLELAVDIRSFFEKQKCTTQLIYGLGDFYDRKKSEKGPVNQLCFQRRMRLIY